MPSKGGAGPLSGLWMGTAVFSALGAKTFGGFVKSYLMYAVVLVAGLMVVAWVLSRLGLRMERFSVADIQCQPGETPTSSCGGERGCMKPSGNCYKLVSSGDAPPA